MPKRRTRAQKIKAQKKNETAKRFLESKKKAVSATRVKGYLESVPKISADKIDKSDKPVKMGEIANLKLTKRALAKSLITSSFILCLEVVLYLLWYK